MSDLPDGAAISLIVLVAMAVVFGFLWLLAQLPHSPGTCPRCGHALPCVHCFPCPMCGWMP